MAWEGWDSSYNSWEPYSFIVDDQLIQEYEERADKAEDEAAEVELDKAEEVAAEAAAEVSAEATAEDEQPMETEELEPAPTPAPAPTLAPAELPILPSFRSDLCATVPAELQEQMAAIEADFSKGHQRNGAKFEDYFSRWDLMTHLAIAPSGDLIGFAVSGTEQRGVKVFLYELHVHKDWRRRGIGTALMDMAWRTARGANRTMELNVHKDNEEALDFYEKKCGFGRCGEVSNGLSFVMRRKL